jgi:hypothetical protein
VVSVNQRRQREFDVIDDVDEILKILHVEFSKKKLYLRYSVDKAEVHINEFRPDSTLMIVVDSDYRVPDNNNISIYGLSDKYIEVDLDVIEQKGPGYYHCAVISGRRAAKGRNDLRFKVNHEDVYATNFRVSKHTIDVTNYNIPTSVKVLLDQFQNTNARLSDQVKVDVFSSEDKDVLLKSIRKTGNMLYIKDVSDQASFTPLTEDFVDISDVLGHDLPRLMRYYSDKGYKSHIIVPIIYLTEDSRSLPFAYIQLLSKTEHFEIDKVLELKDLSFKLVDRIRDSNTTLLSVRQEIVDISRGGAKLRITEETIRKNIQKARGFIFDIVFKLQAPITMYGDIKSTLVDPSGDLFVGVDFEGNSSRKDEIKRFYSIIQPMEADYKANLIKTLNAQKRVQDKTSKR